MKWFPWLAKNPLLAVAGAATLVLGAVFVSRATAPSESSGDPGDGGTAASLLPPGGRVLVAGDSLGVGITAPMKKLAAAAGSELEGHAVVGSRIDQWDDETIDNFLSFGPAVVVLSLGTNDMKMFDPATKQAPRAASLIARIRAAGAKVAWVVPPTMPFDDKGVRQMIADAGPDLLVRADLLELPRAADKIHMTPSGYQELAEVVWNCVAANQCP